jgi:hypothetical protein
LRLSFLALSRVEQRCVKFMTKSHLTLAMVRGAS